MVRGIDYGAYDWLQVGQLEALQGLSPQGPKYGLQLMSDGYIVENVLSELRNG